MKQSTLCRAALVALLAAFSPVSARSQTPAPSSEPAPPDAPPNGETEMAPDSPRASLAEFFALTNQGRFQDAAGFLDLTPAQAATGAEQVRRLKAVLDRHLGIELDTISPLSVGDENDGQPRGVEQIGNVPSEGHNEPVRLVRRETPAGGRWLFSRSTVARIDRWHDELDDRWIRSYLPQPLLRFGPQPLLLWQWLALPLLLGLAWYAGRVLSWLTRRLLHAVTRRTPGGRDDRLVHSLRVPLALAWAVAVALVLLRYLGLNPAGQDFVNMMLSVAAIVALFGAIFAVVDVLGEGARSAHWYATNPSAQSVLQLSVRAGKALVIALGVVAVLLEMGYPVASVLAGLGIGGIALALAAKTTVENLFGSVSLAVDEAVRVGDFVKIDEQTMGNVEAIGLRSTRIRTLDRTLVSIPNGVLATMRIESFTARDRVRLQCVLALEYGTSSARMRDVIARIEKLLRAHPRIWPDDMTVSFKQFGLSSLDVEVVAWFDVTWAQYKNEMRSELLLQIMEAVEQAGCAFAFPTQTLRVARDAPPAQPSPG